LNNEERRLDSADPPLTRRPQEKNMKYYCCDCDRELVDGMVTTRYTERGKDFLLCHGCVQAHWDWFDKLMRAETRHNRLRMPQVYEDTDIGKPELLSLRIPHRDGKAVTILQEVVRNPIADDKGDVIIDDRMFIEIRVYGESEATNDSETAKTHTNQAPEVDARGYS
jgi:hypothetical protein